tara:strand:+ start:224 stop:430 length:207 start_codon:yes stop_codon:yes gene_type:complete
MKVSTDKLPSTFIKVVVPQSTVARLRAFAPAGNVSYFVREAIEAKLKEVGSPDPATMRNDGRLVYPAE